MTVLKEFPKFDVFFARHTLIATLIPNWSFFAPVPGMHDYILRYRYFDKEKKPSNWLTVEQTKKDIPCLHFIWNPQKRFSKALFDIISDLNQFNNESKDNNQLRISLPYLQLLNFLNGQPHRSSVKYFQFSVSRYSRIFDEEFIFQSDIHPIELQDVKV